MKIAFQKTLKTQKNMGYFKRTFDWQKKYAKN